MSEDAFFIVHKDLPREGPGEAADVDWAMDLIRPAPDARICDAGCGPGGDIDDLLRHIPSGQLYACDLHGPFIDDVRSRFSDDPRVTAEARDMSKLSGPFDLIWCAGALYFLGGAAGLSKIGHALSPSGTIAFSEPCFFTDTPSQDARDFWEGEDAKVRTEAGIAQAVQASGFEVLGTRRLQASAWEAYYGPMAARVAELRSNADSALTQALDDAEREIALWRAAQDETGYLLVVARKT